MQLGYQSDTIPWHFFVPHVQIISTQSSSDESEFAVHASSTIESRDADYTAFARSLASTIADDAERRRSTMPKPNASIQTWRDVGVDDDTLFPSEYLSRVAGMHHPAAEIRRPGSPERAESPKYTSKVDWEYQYCPDIGAHRAASALLVVVMTEPPDQFQSLYPNFSLIPLKKKFRLKTDLATMVGLHYSLPPRHSYEKDYEKGIVAYINLTLSNFLLVNIIVSVARERVLQSDLRLPRQYQSWNPPLATNYRTAELLDAASFTDRLHYGFWRNLSNDPLLTQSELLDNINQHSHRCFNFLVLWYAVMMESFHTRRALDRTYPVYFGPEQLTAVILLQLRSLDSAFNVQSLDATDPVAFVHRFNTSSALSADSITEGESSIAAPVPFLSLPPELHLYTLSYLPTRALLSVMRVCTSMRKICPDLIYTNPMGIIDNFSHIDSDPGMRDVISRRFAKLLALLLAQPDLCSRLRTFTLRACDILDDPTPNYARYGFNLSDPIVEHMNNLSHLTLLVPYPVCAKCAARDSSWCKDRLQQTIPDIIYRWPSLHALTVSYLRRDDVVLCLDHDVTESPTQGSSMLALDGAVRPWKLQSLTVKQPPWPLGSVPPAEQHDHISLHCLVKMSAHTLRRLSLHPQSLGALGDLEKFPICPAVEHLKLRSALDGPSLKLLLERCFAAITFLHVSFDSQFSTQPVFVGDFVALDLSGCHLLRHAAVDEYPISGFPPSLESLDLGVGLNANHISATTHVKAVALCSSAVHYNNESGGDRQARQVCDALGQTFPALYCLDMPTIWDRVWDNNLDSTMDTLSSIVAGSLPSLRILILDIAQGILSSRLCRSDFPSDDGGDRRQHDYALVFFRACPALNIISFNGVPSKDPPAFLQPDRVWRRTTVDGAVEAEMTSRESLPWNFLQYRRKNISSTV